MADETKNVAVNVASTEQKPASPTPQKAPTQNSWDKFWSTAPISEWGILGITLGIVGIFVLEIVLGLLAIICALIGRKVRKDELGFYLATGMGVLCVLVWVVIWSFKSFSQGGFWM